MEDLDDVSLAAHERALNFLSFRPRSKAEVRLNLIRHGVEQTVVENVIARLETAGLLGDEEFARFWVRSREQFSPRGRRAIRQELLQKGVDRDIIATVMESTPVDESGLALVAARKRVRSYRGLTSEQFAKRLIPYLQRRGFPYEMARIAMETVWREIGQDADSDQGSQ